MGFLSDIFSGIDDVAHEGLGALDDAAHGDWSGIEDRSNMALSDTMENGALSSVALPVVDYFTAGMGSTAMKAKYNKNKYGHSYTNFGDVAKGYLANQVSAGVADGLGYSYAPSSSLGNVAYNGAVGAGRGALSYGLQGESMTDGAVQGATGAGLSSLGNYGGTFFAGDAPDTGSLGGSMQDEYGESSATLGGQTTQTQSNANQQANTLNKSYGGVGNQTQLPVLEQSQGYSPESPQLEQAQPSSSSLSPSVAGFLDAINGGGRDNSNYMGMASNLYGLYNAHKDKKRTRQQADQLQSLYSPNSAYAQNMRQGLERRDAAAGRRSQYGAREVDLAAKLADTNARMAPTLNSLYNQESTYRNQGANNIMQLGKQIDYGSLYKMFGGG